MSMSSPSTTTASDLDVVRTRLAEELWGICRNTSNA